MANMSYGSMNVSALKAELRKRGAKLSGLKEQLIQRLKDYDRNNNFKRNIEDEILQNDLAYIVEWPSDSLYSSITSKSVSPNLDVVNITTYFLKVYEDNVGMTEYTAVHNKGYNMTINKYLVALVICTQNNLLFIKMWHCTMDDYVRNRVINYCSSEKTSFGISGVFEVAFLYGISNDHDYLKLLKNGFCAEGCEFYSHQGQTFV